MTCERSGNATKWRSMWVCGPDACVPYPEECGNVVVADLAMSIHAECSGRESRESREYGTRTLQSPTSPKGGLLLAKQARAGHGCGRVRLSQQERDYRTLSDKCAFADDAARTPPSATRIHHQLFRPRARLDLRTSISPRFDSICFAYRLRSLGTQAWKEVALMSRRCAGLLLLRPCFEGKASPRTPSTTPALYGTCMRSAPSCPYRCKRPLSNRCSWPRLPHNNAATFSRHAIALFWICSTTMTCRWHASLRFVTAPGPIVWPAANVCLAVSFLLVQTPLAHLPLPLSHVLSLFLVNQAWMFAFQPHAYSSAKRDIAPSWWIDT